MSVIRKNPVTNDWVIFAPNRNNRPQEYHHQENDNVAILEARPNYRDTCPFCPGNEKFDDRVIFTLPTTGPWQVRVIENKYASLDRRTNAERLSSGLRKEMTGFGIHDVFVDHPMHNFALAKMQTEDLNVLLEAWQKRYLDLSALPDVRHVVVFKNQGMRAGGSLEHPHSQIYGLPVVPFETQVRLREMERYFEIRDRCLLCDLLEDELREGSRIVAQNSDFVALLPFADLSPYHFWILPIRHAASFGLLGLSERTTLSQILIDVFGRLYRHLRNPDFNLVIQSLTHFEREAPSFHWYVSVIPQLKHKGGLEYAGGLYVNPVLPEEAADGLRNA